MSLLFFFLWPILVPCILNKLKHCGSTHNTNIYVRWRALASMFTVWISKVSLNVFINQGEKQLQMHKIFFLRPARWRLLLRARSAFMLSQVQMVSTLLQAVETIPQPGDCFSLGFRTNPREYKHATCKFKLGSRRLLVTSEEKGFGAAFQWEQQNQNCFKGEVNKAWVDYIMSLPLIGEDWIHSPMMFLLVVYPIRT